MEDVNNDIILYRIHKGVPIFVRQGIRERQWMDQTEDKYAYRCLPLIIANQNGYEVCTKKPIKIVWNGGNKVSDIHVDTDRPDIVKSHFGNGVVTFHTNLLIRTPKGINTYVTGSPNLPKRGITPLSGIVETDWNPATFTMNWKITEPFFEIVFEPWEPFCFFYPIERSYVEKFTTTIKSLDENQEEYTAHREWAKSRAEFKDKVEEKVKNKEATWQKHYFQGVHLDGSKPEVDHQTKIKLNDINVELND